MMILAPTITAVLRRFWSVARAPNPPDWFLVVDLAYALGAMAVGGLVCAWIARRSMPPLVLAGVVLVLGVATAWAGLDPAHPGWYLWSVAVLSPIAVLTGARVLLRPDQRLSG
jgi:hypothetical protein